MFLFRTTFILMKLHPRRQDLSISKKIQPNELKSKSLSVQKVNLDQYLCSWTLALENLEMLFLYSIQDRKVKFFIGNISIYKKSWEKQTRFSDKYLYVRLFGCIEHGSNISIKQMQPELHVMVQRTTICLKQEVFVK